MPDALLVYVAGVAWDGVEGTDHRLVGHLRERIPVLWVDPPAPVTTRRARRRAGQPVAQRGLSSAGPGLWRLHTVVTPGVTRPIGRTLARLLVERALRRACRALGGSTRVAVVAHAEARVRKVPAARRLLHLTDDLEAGAGLLGLRRSRVRRLLRQNVRDADLVSCVSEELRRRTAGATGRPVLVLPNGCEPDQVLDVSDAPPVPVVVPAPVVGLVGQLNERLDVELLDALAETGCSLLLVGPRYERPGPTRQGLDGLLARENVQWVDRQPYSALPHYLRAMHVGITPYLDTEFNRSSDPLKTLEYLAAGLPVVTTDLPSARALHHELVQIAPDRASFVDLVQAELARPAGPARARAARELAHEHNWASRADLLLAWLLPERSADQPDTARRHAGAGGAPHTVDGTGGAASEDSSALGTTSVRR